VSELSDNDVLELKNMVRDMQHDVKKIDRQVSSMQNTVDLLIEGKIKTSTQSSDGMTKVTLAVIELTRMAIAGVIGFFAGRGGN
jgi:hypothetical protein